MSNLENLTAKAKEIADLKEKFIQEARGVLKPALMEVFEKFSWIEEIYWTQYTPYFNDGDECIFSVNEFYINKYDSSGWPHFRMENQTVKKLTDEEKEPYNILYNISASLGEDVFKEVFGNHVQVTITRDGNFEIDDYNHE